MQDRAICVRNLGKSYRLGARAKAYKTIRESMTGLANSSVRAVRSAIARRGLPASTREILWSLRDISFDVRPGEILGIIGHNGAGKSTLLKILSRITEPTEGEADIFGRVGSLLEVGTGFHGELTGRENVYFNGSILGMSRADINRKFDEIVDFAEVERFIDTPVKHYSSGMRMRLAFAVAAHLDPEILIIDEVLAVGDVQFQRKCLDKMGEVGRAGRTVLFVSHHLATIKSLCHRVLTLEKGRLVGEGDPEEQVSRYLSQLGTMSSSDLKERRDREGNGVAKINRVEFVSGESGASHRVFSGSPLRIVMSYSSSVTDCRPSLLAIGIWSEEGHRVFHSDNQEVGSVLTSLQSEGEYSCVIPKLPLPPGRYAINALISVDGEVADFIRHAAVFEVLPGDFYGTGRPVSNHRHTLIDNRWE